MSKLTDLAGRIRASDSREFTPACLWAEQFGEVRAPSAQFILDQWDPDALVSLSVPVKRDEELALWRRRVRDWCVL
jgi:hypothetical protein